MALLDQISADIKSAMKAREKVKLAALRDVKSKLLLEATAGTGEITEAAGAKIVLKLYKQRIDTYDLFIKEGREDLAADEKAQAEVIKEYLPKMLSEDEIKAEVDAAIATTGAAGPQDMGKVMGILSGKLAGKADGKLIADTVKAALLK
ncbi:MAG: GatB/YqeY domain-containing protein [Crocinitomicaceae bacterium]|nr:GatB/YqeY domain-containing protein [Flavobacteriales bacterium]NQZ37625.1 GatB/YqeY domain-containing protein [Crocinitomicaceae bacterium]PHR31385.1 MAG: glutamyl-tRNA amidotransferase [Fluviicola sp.]